MLFINVCPLQVFMNRFLPLVLFFLLPSAVYAQINAFGLSSEVAGSSIFVGHPVPDDDESGLVYVYQLSEDGEAWEVAGELMASDAKPGDAFGYSIASDGDHLAIGAPSLDGLGGAVYVFVPQPGNRRLAGSSQNDRHCRSSHRRRRCHCRIYPGYQWHGRR